MPRPARHGEEQAGAAQGGAGGEPSEEGDAHGGRRMVVASVASSVHWMVTMGKGGRSDGGACCRRGGGSTRCFEDFAPAASAGSGTCSPRTVGSGNREPVVWLSGRGWFDRLTRDAGCGTRLIGAPGFPPATSSGQALRGRRDGVWLLGSGVSRGRRWRVLALMSLPALQSVQATPGGMAGLGRSGAAGRVRPAHGLRRHRGDCVLDAYASNRHG